MNESDCPWVLEILGHVSVFQCLAFGNARFADPDCTIRVKISACNMYNAFSAYVIVRGY